MAREISAGRDLLLAADGDITLESSQDLSTLHSQNQSSGASIGVAISFGSSTGISFSASANQARGKANGDDAIQQNTHVTAGRAIQIQSGADTTLAGATIVAPTVKADIGGNLLIESRQDTSTYTSAQKSSGMGVSLCIPPICYGASSVSGSVGKQNADSYYRSVTEQSGIRAGDGGFQVSVGGGATPRSQAAPSRGVAPAARL